MGCIQRIRSDTDRGGAACIRSRSGGAEHGREKIPHVCRLNDFLVYTSSVVLRYELPFSKHQYVRPTPTQKLGVISLCLHSWPSAKKECVTECRFVLKCSEDTQGGNVYTMT